MPGPDESGEGVADEPVPQTSEDARKVLRAPLPQQSQEALRSEGQRTVSMLWETTQKRIAEITVGGAVALAFVVVVFGGWLGLEKDIRIAAFMFLAGAANLVIGFYYGRTNHQRVGGPGGDTAGSR